MKLYDINSHDTLFTFTTYNNVQVRTISTERKGHAPVGEPELLEMLAAAIRQQALLTEAIRDIRILLQCPMKLEEQT